MNIKTNEDIVQEALTIIYEKYKETEFKKGFMPWAYTIVDNVTKGDYRKEKRRKDLIDKNIEKLYKIDENIKSATDDLSEWELDEEIMRALNQLSNKQKAIFELILKGFSRDEIQRQLGLSRNVLDVCVFRGRKKIKQELEKRGVFVNEMY